MHAMSISGDAAACVFAAEAFIVEEWHFVWL